MKRTLLTTAAALLFTAVLHAGDFYVDPEKGDPANDGSAARPWKSLQGVIDQGLVKTEDWDKLPARNATKKVAKNADAPVGPGDTIWLRSGDYGALKIEGYYNTGNITIAAQKGQWPRFTQILIRASGNWTLRGLHVSPEFGDDTKKRTLIDVDSHGWRGPAEDVTVEDCILFSARETGAWTIADWNTLACNGINADGPRMTIRRNRMKNVNFGVSASGANSLVEFNLVENFSGDGLRGTGDHSVFQYNVIKNCYDVNDNHDDGFQSWSSGPKGPGSGRITGMVLRGNTIINYEDPDQPHRGPLQGIGCFDGMFVDWVVENNVIVVDHWHGITLLGAEGCRIVNNTVASPPGRSAKIGPPWIQIGKHKKGTPSTGCVIRNNLAPDIRAGRGQEVAVDHNVKYKDAALVFVDAGAFDFQLKPDSPAIDAGAPEGAPKTDAARKKRLHGNAVDAGALEFGSR